MTGRPPGTDLDDAALAEVYAAPRRAWLRVNMVSTLDGAATGESGVTGSINNHVDKRVFDLLRSTADALLVGAGTARTEGYGPTVLPVVLVTRTAEVPPRLRDAEPGRVLLATIPEAPGLAEAQQVLGEENVVLTGPVAVDLRSVVAQLAARGLTNLLSEGGPSLLRHLLAAGLVDEVCLTQVPRLIAGVHPRITTGGPVD